MDESRNAVISRQRLLYDGSSPSFLASVDDEFVSHPIRDVAFDYPIQMNKDLYNFQDIRDEAEFESQGTFERFALYSAITYPEHRDEIMAELGKVSFADIDNNILYIDLDRLVNENPNVTQPEVMSHIDDVYQRSEYLRPAIDKVMATGEDIGFKSGDWKTFLIQLMEHSRSNAIRQIVYELDRKLNNDGSYSGSFLLSESPNSIECLFEFNRAIQKAFIATAPSEPEMFDRFLELSKSFPKNQIPRIRESWDMLSSKFDQRKVLSDYETYSKRHKESGDERYMKSPVRWLESYEMDANRGKFSRYRYDGLESESGDVKVDTNRYIEQFVDDTRDTLIGEYASFQKIEVLPLGLDGEREYNIFLGLPYSDERKIRDGGSIIDSITKGIVCHAIANESARRDIFEKVSPNDIDGYGLRMLFSFLKTLDENGIEFDQTNYLQLFEDAIRSGKFGLGDDNYLRQVALSEQGTTNKSTFGVTMSIAMREYWKEDMLHDESVGIDAYIDYLFENKRIVSLKRLAGTLNDKINISPFALDDSTDLLEHVYHGYQEAIEVFAPKEFQIFKQLVDVSKDFPREQVQQVREEWLKTIGTESPHIVFSEFNDYVQDCAMRGKQMYQKSPLRWLRERQAGQSEHKPISVLRSETAGKNPTLDKTMMNDIVQPQHHVGGIGPI